jgi:hypothetical protein
LESESEKDDTPSDSVVRGRVVYDDTSRPVRRARVMLITEGGGRGEYAALTDSRGDFQIRNVRAGTYHAFVDLPGVLSPVGFISVEEMRAGAGVPDLGEARKYFDRVEVDGKQDASVTVHARRGASISGRASYADGDPAVNVTVSLMRRGPGGRLQKYLTGGNLVALAGLRTDDRGMFRMAGLPPGEYVVAVSEAANHGGSDADPAGGGDEFPGALRGMFGQQFLVTFHPSATSVKEATAVKVEIGEERADVDITIPERSLRSISGVVRSRRGGLPVARARISITRRDDPLALSGPVAAYYEQLEEFSNGTTTDEQGRWQLYDIPDGAYTISVKPPEEYETPAAAPGMNSNLAAPTNANAAAYTPPRRKRGYAPTRRDLEVSGDVSEFIVEVADGARITGTISVEGGATLRYAYVGAVRVDGGVPDDSSARSAYSEGTRFNVEGLPAGKYFLQPSVGGSESTIYLKSITWNGKDLLREPLELAEGAAAEGVRVVFASNPSTLRVTVRAPEGKRPAPGVYVYLVPSDISQWSPHVRPFFCATDNTGVCMVTAPPGDYRVVALRRLSMTPATYEQEIRQRAANAPRITLREGETSQTEVEAPD